jgi:hypothetical protein
MANVPKVPAVVDDPDAPVVFADVLIGGGPAQGNLNFTFAVLQFDHGTNPPTPYQRVCLRLVMPATAVKAAQEFIALQIQNALAAPPAPPMKPTLQ